MVDSQSIAALKRAIEVLGSQSGAAVAIGIKQQTVSGIVRNGDRVPAEWCIPLDIATAKAGERVPCHQLRSDLWPENFQPEKDMAA